jgi:alkanesulfonate monooxygenase SsuD/methylene tetrahydromethanopterin reductase-like flavin-dependent oxidoreductase (luciferase family)
VSHGRPEVGLLLPTFAAQCRPGRVLDAARKAEQYGFHSLWVRDHLFVPEGLTHGGIRESGRHLEPLIALAAAGAVTRCILLGQAVLIPLRHPLALAQALGTLVHLAGERRLLVGLGAGFNPAEFSAVGLAYERRFRILEETVEILRRTWSGEPVSYKGQVFAFESVRIDPVPPADTPIWYGGTGSAASVRRAVAHFDGWMGGGPADVLDELLTLLRRLEAEHGRRITVSTIPLTSVARTRTAALACLDVPKLIHSMNHTMKRTYRTFEEIESALIVGTPEEAAAQLRALAARGVDVVILDLRQVGEAFDDVLDLIGEELLPRLS